MPLHCRFHLIEDAEVELDVDEALIDLDDETKRCVKVMTFKMNWIDYYWTEPMLVGLVGGKRSGLLCHTLVLIVVVCGQTPSLKLREHGSAALTLASAFVLYRLYTGGFVELCKRCRCRCHFRSVVVILGRARL